MFSILKCKLCPYIVRNPGHYLIRNSQQYVTVNVGCYTAKHQMMSKILLPLYYAQKNAIFLYKGLYVRVKSDIPKYLVVLHLYCYNT